MRRLVSVVVMVTLLSVGCSDDQAPGSTDPAEAAAGVCGVLVDFDDEVADAVNEAAGEIRPSTDPDEARRLLLDATDRVEDAAQDLPDRYADLDLTADGEIGRLVAEASDVTGDLDAQLADIRHDLTDGLDGEDAFAILSHTFVGMEKVQSLSQPEAPDDLDDPLRRALDAEPDCEHTLSR